LGFAPSRRLTLVVAMHLVARRSDFDRLSRRRMSRVAVPPGEPKAAARLNLVHARKGRLVERRRVPSLASALCGARCLEAELNPVAMPHSPKPGRLTGRAPAVLAEWPLSLVPCPCVRFRCGRCVATSQAMVARNALPPASVLGYSPCADLIAATRGSLAEIARIAEIPARNRRPQHLRNSVPSRPGARKLRA
jgi:hypothetical protein